MLNEYARRGFVDGRGVRLPSIVVRPGAPNAATTSCFSGAVREPLDGAQSVLPVPLDLPHPAASVGVAVGGILDLMRADAAALDADRVYNLPSIGVTLGALKARPSGSPPRAPPPRPRGSARGSSAPTRASPRSSRACRSTRTAAGPSSSACGRTRASTRSWPSMRATCSRPALP